MHILIASDGHLDSEKATAMVSRLVEPDDEVTVLTAVDHPRELPRGSAEMTGAEQVAKIAHEAGPGMIGFASGAVVAERLAPIMQAAYGKPEPRLGEYFETTALRRLKGLLGRLASRGIEANAIWSPTDNQTAKTILKVAERAEADVLVIGGHGRRRFEGALGSTATNVLKRAEMPVVVIK